MSAAPVPSPPPIHFVPISLVDASPTNPRKRFDQGALEDLAASIKEKGILQPPLLRPSPVTEGRYEIVAGERRCRAAELAGLAEIPALIRDLTDKDVVVMQVIENQQREDLHELEEAEGYERLINDHGYTAESLAVEIGLSKAYVYGRMKLCALTAYAREAFYAGVLNASTAVLVARIPVPELQQKAIEEIMRGGSDTFRGEPQPMSVREAAEHIQERYMLRLDDAVFDTKDPNLLPDAGPCTTCPKRTGNNKELFGDIKNPNVCTDPECWSAKKETLWLRARDKAHDQGHTVLDDKTAKKIFSPQRPHRLVNDAYVDLDDACELDEKRRHWRAVLGKHLVATDGRAGVPVFLARDPGGNVRQLAPRPACERVAFEKFPKIAEQAQQELADRKKSDVERKRDKERAALREAVLKEAVKEMAVTLEMRPADLKVWRFLLVLLLNTDRADQETNPRTWFLERLGIDPKDKDPIARAEKLAVHMTEGQARAAVFELALFAPYVAYAGFIEGDGKGLVADACKLLNVDVKKLEATVKSLVVQTSADGGEDASGSDDAPAPKPAKGSKKKPAPKKKPSKAKAKGKK